MRCKRLDKSEAIFTMQYFLMELNGKSFSDCKSKVPMLLCLKLRGELKDFFYSCLPIGEISLEMKCVKAKGKWRDPLRYKDLWYVLPGE